MRWFFLFYGQYQQAVCDSTTKVYLDEKDIYVFGHFVRLAAFPSATEEESTKITFAQEGIDETLGIDGFSFPNVFDIFGKNVNRTILFLATNYIYTDVSSIFVDVRMHWKS